MSVTVSSNWKVVGGFRLLCTSIVSPSTACTSAELAETHVVGIGFTPRRSMAAEDIRNFQSWACRERRSLCGRLILLGLSSVKRFSKLMISLMTLVAMRVGRMELPSSWVLQSCKIQ